MPRHEPSKDSTAYTLDPQCLHLGQLDTLGQKRAPCLSQRQIDLEVELEAVGLGPVAERLVGKRSGCSQVHRVLR